MLLLWRCEGEVLRVGGCLLVLENRVFHWMLAVLPRTTGGVALYARSLAEAPWATCCGWRWRKTVGANGFFTAESRDSVSDSMFRRCRCFCTAAVLPASVVFLQRLRIGSCLFQSSRCLVHRGRSS